MKKRSDGAGILLDSIFKGIFEKKGSDIVRIDLKPLENRIADFFVICHGNSATQVDAICDSVENTVLKYAKEKPLRIEGLENCYWVLIDYGNVIVHIFQETYREFYSLESLWADALIEKIEEKN